MIQVGQDAEDSRPSEDDLRPCENDFRPSEGEFRPSEDDFRSSEDDFRPKYDYFSPSKNNINSMKTQGEMTQVGREGGGLLCQHLRRRGLQCYSSN